jgi:FkbM family methyltransferase
MEPQAAHYKPSLTDPRKYLVYADYFKEYLACGDFKSLGASLKYMFTHRLPVKGFQTKSRMGKFMIRPHTTDFQFINFAYEREIKEYMLKNIDSFDVFIDVGACIGEYCVWLAKLGKKCIAIEPVNNAAVRANVELNHMAHMVKVLPCGLGKNKEKVYFNIPYGIPSSSYMDRDTDKEPNVDIETFDSVYETFGIPESGKVLVKLDVEGMEPDVIEGAKKFISSFKNITFIYEHFESDDYRNDKALSAHANFVFSDIDKANRLAVKK